MNNEITWLKTEISKMTKKIASLKKKPSCTLHDMEIRRLKRKRVHYEERIATARKIHRR